MYIHCINNHKVMYSKKNLSHSILISCLLHVLYHIYIYIYILHRYAYRHRHRLDTDIIICYVLIWVLDNT